MSPAALDTSAKRCAACCPSRSTRWSASTSCPRLTPPVVGSIADRATVRECVAGADAVVHSATLHKPHVGSHGRAEFVDTNITGTLNLLEEAVCRGRRRFLFTSTTSAFGRALTPDEREPGGVDHRGRRPGPPQHLRHDQDRGREPVRADRARPRAADPDPADVAVLPRARRPRRRPRHVRRREHQGQRVALPPRRHRGRGERPPARAGARAGDRVRPATSSARPRRSRATT